MKITATEQTVLDRMAERGGVLKWVATTGQETQALMRLVRKGVVIRVGNAGLDSETYWRLADTH